MKVTVHGSTTPESLWILDHGREPQESWRHHTTLVVNKESKSPYRWNILVDESLDTHTFHVL